MECVGNVPSKDRSPKQKLGHLSPDQCYTFLYIQDQDGERVHFRHPEVSDCLPEQKETKSFRDNVMLVTSS